MPILPIIDLLILTGWSSLFAAFALKAIWITTSYRPLLFGLGALDLIVTAGIFLLFALALAARTWVKTQDLQAYSASVRAAATLDAYTALRQEGDPLDLAGAAAHSAAVDQPASGVPAAARVRVRSYPTGRGGDPARRRGGLSGPQNPTRTRTRKSACGARQCEWRGSCT
jgi:hypothetical protein